MSPLDGSSTIYHKIVLPLFKRNQSKIDEALDKGRGYARKALDEVAKFAAEGDVKKFE